MSVDPKSSTDHRSGAEKRRSSRVARKRRPDGTFPKGHLPPRRPRGSANKITRDLKAGIIEGAVKVGRDGKGGGGLRISGDVRPQASQTVHDIARATLAVCRLRQPRRGRRRPGPACPCRQIASSPRNSSRPSIPSSRSCRRRRSSCRRSSPPRTNRPRPTNRSPSPTCFGLQKEIK